LAFSRLTANWLATVGAVLAIDLERKTFADPRAAQRERTAGTEHRVEAAIRAVANDVRVIGARECPERLAADDDRAIRLQHDIARGVRATVDVCRNLAVRGRAGCTSVCG
jgi:hypothetical protein